MCCMLRPSHSPSDQALIQNSRRDIGNFMRVVSDIDQPKRRQLFTTRHYVTCQRTSAFTGKNCSDTPTILVRLFKIHSNNMALQRLFPKHPVIRMFSDQTADKVNMCLACSSFTH
jgi:hypothetical protein